MSDACCQTTPVAPPAPEPLLRQRRAPLMRLGIAAATWSGGLVAGWLGVPAVSLALFVITIAICLPTPAQRAWKSVTRRVLDINVLMVIAVIGAAALGDWPEAAAVVWLFGVAQELVGAAVGRAGDAPEFGREAADGPERVGHGRSLAPNADGWLDTIPTGALGFRAA